MPVAYIAQEAILGGQLFDYIKMKKEGFSEKLCRYYLYQILQGLQHIHDKGLCHLDMKPENILIDNNYDAKIVDFGFATESAGEDGNGLKEVNGTEGYMAPEIAVKKPYDGQSVDLFACGVILFMMLTGESPFARAENADLFYRQIIEKCDLFWKVHKSDKPTGFFSNEFKSLFSAMVAHDPQERLSIADVIGHPWMQGEIAT